MNFRMLIRNRLHETRSRPADLLRTLEGKVGKQSLYDYLAGRSNSIGSDSLGLIFGALGLTVVSKTELEQLRDRAEIVRDAVAAIRKEMPVTPTYNSNPPPPGKVFKGITSPFPKKTGGLNCDSPPEKEKM